MDTETYTNAARLVHDVREAFNDYWDSVEDSGADEDIETRYIREFIVEKFGDRLSAVGKISYMTALFAEKAGPGAHGAILASRFVWISLEFDEWVAIVAKTVAKPRAWYEIMWFLIGTIGIDYFHIVETNQLLPSLEINKQKINYPSKITIAEPEFDDSSALEFEDRKQMENCLNKLIAQGAKLASVREIDRR